MYELILLSVTFENTMLRYNDVMFCFNTNCAAQVRKKWFIKILRQPSVVVSQQRRLEPSRIRCMEGSVAERVSHSDFQLGLHICLENLDQQIINKWYKYIEHWRVRLEAMDRVKSGHTEQLFWLTGSFSTVLLCGVCVLRTRVYFAIVNPTLPW